jgi:hypothetical protein
MWGKGGNSIAEDIESNLQFYRRVKSFVLNGIRNT